MIDSDIKSNKSLCECDCDIRVQVISLPFKSGMFQRADPHDQISLIAVYVGFAFSHKLVLLAILHPRLYLHF